MEAERRQVKHLNNNNKLNANLLMLRWVEVNLDKNFWISRKPLNEAEYAIITPGFDPSYLDEHGPLLSRLTDWVEMKGKLIYRIRVFAQNKRTN
jgi:hypothetical protein